MRLRIVQWRLELLTPRSCLDSGSKVVSMACSSTLFVSDLLIEIIENETVSLPLPVFPIPAKRQQAISLEEMESLHIAKTLVLAQYNKSRAAEILGIDRGTLYRKALQYGISLACHTPVDKLAAGIE